MEIGCCPPGQFWMDPVPSQGSTHAPKPGTQLGARLGVPQSRGAASEVIGRPGGLQQPQLHCRMDLDRKVEHQKIRRIHTSHDWWWIGLLITTPLCEAI